MNTTTQIMQAINAVSQKVNDLSKRLDDCYKMITDNNTANIDYIAMIEDIDLDNEETQEVS